MPRLHKQLGSLVQGALFAAFAATFAYGCDASPEAPPSGFGGGPIPWHEPTEENVANSRYGTFEFSHLPPPVGAEAYQLPGMPKPGVVGQPTDANGGSGAGTTGTLGVGESTTRGLNPESATRRPVPEGSNFDLQPRALPPPSPVGVPPAFQD